MSPHGLSHPWRYTSSQCVCKSFQALLLSFNQGSRVLLDDVHAIFLQKGSSSCAQAKGLDFCRKLHALMLCNDLDSTSFLGEHLIYRFVTFGSLFEANIALCRVPEPSVYAWQDMLSFYIRNGQNGRAVSLYKKMENEGSYINKFIFTGALKACGALGTIVIGKEIHGKLIKSGCDYDPFVVSVLIDMYIKCDYLDEARKVFDVYIFTSIHDKVVWSTMISGYAQYGHFNRALELFSNMQMEGHEPSVYIYSSILKACCSVGAGEEGKHIHGCIIKTGLSFDSVVANSLINMYASHGNLVDAREVFDRMGNRTIVSWGTMIAGYAHHGCGLPALNLFSCMHHEGIDPNRPILLYILKACATIDAIIEGMVMHDHIIKGGLESEVRIGMGLVEIYSKCGRLSDSHKSHDNLPEKNLVSWCILIRGYVDWGHGLSALNLLRNLQHEGVLLDKVLYLCFLKACRIVGNIWYIKLAHIQIISNMLASDDTIVNSLLDAYSRCPDMTEARKLFEETSMKSVVSWSSMVAGYANHGQNLIAIGLYNKMCQSDKQADRVIYLSVMKACAKLGSSLHAKEVHDHIIRAGIEEDTTIGNSVINMYAKCGVLDEASKVFYTLPNKDILSWGAIMDGYTCNGGLCGQIRQCLQAIEQQGLKPNDAIFLSLLSACGHVGAVAEAIELFHSMKIEHGIIPNIKHITCMGDLLGRAGSLEEAKCFLLGNFDSMGWTSLLSASRIHCTTNLSSVNPCEVDEFDNNIVKKCSLSHKHLDFGTIIPDACEVGRCV